MATEDEREIYRQRSEAARHSYKLEWQFLQVGTAIGLLTLGIGAGKSGIEWWRFCASGAVFVWFSYAMQRMASGFIKNLPHLHFYAWLVGDPGVHKKNKSCWTSAAVWSRLILHTVGVLLLVHGVRNPDFVLYDPPGAKGALTALMISELILWLSWQFIDAYKWAQPIIPVIRIMLVFIALSLLLTVVFQKPWRFF